MKEALLKIRPELRHQITHDAPRQTGRHAACHHRAANACRRIIEIGSDDAEHHSAYPGRVERSRTGILACDHQAANRVNRAPYYTASRPFAVISGVLVEKGGQNTRAKEILRPKICQRRSKTASIRRVPFAVLRSLVASLREGCAHGGIEHIEGIHGLLQRQRPLLSRRERLYRPCRVCNRLVIRNHPKYAALVERSCNCAGNGKHQRNFWRIRGSNCLCRTSHCHTKGNNRRDLGAANHSMSGRSRNRGGYALFGKGPKGLSLATAQYPRAPAPSSHKGLPAAHERQSVKSFVLTPYVLLQSQPFRRAKLKCSESRA